MRNRLLYLGAVILFLAEWKGDFWLIKWTTLYTLLALTYAYYLGKKVHWSVGAAILPPLLSVVYVGLYKDNPVLAQLSLFDQIAFQKQALKTGLALVALPFFFLLFRSPVPFIKVLKYFCLGNSFFSLLQWSLGIEPMGFVGNLSLNACLISGTYPFLISRVFELFYGRERPLQLAILSTILILPILAIFACGSSMGLAVLGVTLFSYLFSYFRKKILVFLTVGIVVGGPLLIFISSVVPEFWGDSGRFQIWKMTYEYWLIHANHLVGFGPGSTFNYLPYIQRVVNEAKDDTVWLFLHNDFLQTLFEYGLIGLTAVLLMVGFAVAKAWRKSTPLFAAWMGYLAMCFGNWPLRYSIGACFGCILVQLSFRRKYFP